LFTASHKIVHFDGASLICIDQTLKLYLASVELVSKSLDFGLKRTIGCSVFDARVSRDTIGIGHQIAEIFSKRCRRVCLP
jgi:hypothetical protein